MRLPLAASAIVSLFVVAAATHAGEIVRLTADNYDLVAPQGKEVDAIIGDYVLRNDKLIVVVADTLPDRKANMSTKLVGGHIIDFTTRDNGSDQLTACYTAPGVTFTRAKVVSASGPKVVLTVEADATVSAPAASVTYTLADGQASLLVETTIRNAGGQPLTIDPHDDVKAVRTFVSGAEDVTGSCWVVDEWWGQAYGFTAEAEGAAANISRSPFKVRYAAGKPPKVELAPGRSHTFARRMFAAPDVLQLRAAINESRGVRQRPVKFTVKDADGFVADASIALAHGGKPYGSARTMGNGTVAFALPEGTYEAEVAALGRPAVKLAVDASAGDQMVVLEPAGYVVATITTGSRNPIPAKVQFIGVKPTPDPFFFPETGEHAVGNVYYTQHGKFKQALAPGAYDVVISYGPEYDIVERRIKVERGKQAKLNATLVRSVDSTGWVSAEMHSHSSPSGDNVSSQYGRVLNLLCENLEFCPCTEHQRIDSYTPHLRKLGVEHLMATCTGIELTSQLPFNHHNAFPLTMKRYTQDGGGPQVDENPVVQSRRLAEWENGSEKLVQQNHPNLIQVVFGHDVDGKVAPGLQANPTLANLDVIEVHPPANIIEKPGEKGGVSSGSNRIVTWLQLINRGLYRPGVINTDAHYNLHGSGYYRNYIRSSTDDPAKIDTMEMVRACEKGHVVMSTAPFMQVTLTTGGKTAGVGETIVSAAEATLAVKVQCANWYDINRVQVLVSGRPEPSLNFTRQSHPAMFGDKVVKFDQKIPLRLDRDAHIIVVAIGEGLTLGKVFPSGNGAKQPPIAISNPIFVDVDGGGFRPNGDDLGAPLPR